MVLIETSYEHCGSGLYYLEYQVFPHLIEKLLRFESYLFFTVVHVTILLSTSNRSKEKLCKTSSTSDGNHECDKKRKKIKLIYKKTIIDGMLQRSNDRFA